MSNKKNQGLDNRQSNTPPRERILTKEGFFSILDRVIRPVKAKKPRKEKKGTSG